MIFELILTSLLFLLNGASLKVLLGLLKSKDFFGLSFVAVSFAGIWVISAVIFYQFLPLYLVLAALTVSPVVGMMVFEDFCRVLDW